jgi:hypothetical protein
MSVKKSIVALLSIVILIFTGCKKDEIVEPAVQNSSKKLSQIFSDSSNYTNYFYSVDQLIKYESISNGILGYSVSYSFDEKNRCAKEEVIHRIGNIIEDWKNNYIYDENNRVSKVDLNFSSDGISYSQYGHFVFHYNNEGQQTLREYYDSKDSLTQKTTFDYNANGDCEKRIWYIKGSAGFRIYDIITYEYDSSIAPDKDAVTSLVNGFARKTHNIVKSTTTDYNQNNEKESEAVNSFNYVYDSESYPKERIVIYSDDSGNTFTRHDKYIYQ